MKKTFCDWRGKEVDSPFQIIYTIATETTWTRKDEEICSECNAGIVNAIKARQKVIQIFG